MTSEKPTRLAQSADKYIVRLPPGMRDEIAAAAKLNNRSMNAEIVARLGDNAGVAEQLNDAAKLLAGMEPLQARFLQTIEQFNGQLEEKQKLVNLLASSLKSAVEVAQYPEPVGKMMLRYYDELVDAVAAGRGTAQAEEYLSEIAMKCGIDTAKGRAERNAAAHGYSEPLEPMGAPPGQRVRRPAKKT